MTGLFESVAAAADITFLVLHTARDIEDQTVSRAAALLHLLAGLAVSAVRYGGVSAMTFIDMLPGLFLFSVSIISHGGIGTGDGFVLLAGGLMQGCTVIFERLILALTIAAVCGIFLLLRGRVTMKTRLPFVPFLAAAELLCLITRL